MKKRIIICADDFAQNEAISEGIVRLADKQRINAISCLVNAPLWFDVSQQLEHLKSSSLQGLHFNLTFGSPLSTQWARHEGAQFPSLSRLLIASFSRRLRRDCVEAELEAQLDGFVSRTSRLPDFIDGHQHIHQFPVIREALLAVYAKRNLSCFLRATSNGWRDLTSVNQFPKSQLIAALGGMTFKQRLRESAIRCNASFSGIYNFNKAPHFTDYFRHFLKESQDGGLIMCHPGLVSQDKTDPQYPYRHYEYDYFMSNDFLQDLRDNACELSHKESKV